MIKCEKDSPVIELGGGVRRRVMSHGGKMMAVTVDFTAGSVGEMHAHPHEQVTYCVSGRFLLKMAEASCQIGPGDTYYCGPNELHGVECLENGRLVDVFTPIREDFLG